MNRITAFIALLLIVCAVQPAGSSDKKLDEFAKCLTKKKAVMYGSFTCSHCADQKDLFGESFQYVTYVECMVPATHRETDQCKAAGIKYTPTWIFGDGSRVVGKVPLEKLSEETGCKLP